MRILIVTTFFPPQNSIASLRPFSWAKAWSRSGADVTVLTCAVEEDPRLALDCDTSGFSVEAVPAPWLVKRLRRLYSQSVRYQRGRGRTRRWLRPLLALRKATGICHATRMPDPMDLWVGSAVRAGRRLQSFDAIVSTAGPYATHLVAARLMRAGLGGSWFADFRDLWADSELFPGLFPFNWWERRLERRLMRRATAITAVTPGQASVLAGRHGSHKVHLVENGYDQEELRALNPEPAFPRDGVLRIVYTGMIYEGGRDPSPLFAAMARLAQRGELPAMRVLFVGGQMGNLNALVDRFGVEPLVEILGMVSRAEALRMQRDADWLLFLESSQSTALTGKLFEYLAAGRPILGVGIGPSHVAGSLIHEARAGVAVGSDVAALEQLLSGQLSPSYVPSREVVERYERGRLAARYLELLRCQVR